MTIAITVFYFSTKLKIMHNKKIQLKKNELLFCSGIFYRISRNFCYSQNADSADCDRTTVFPVVPAVLQK